MPTRCDRLLSIPDDLRSYWFRREDERGRFPVTEVRLGAEGSVAQEFFVVPDGREDAFPCPASREEMLGEHQLSGGLVGSGRHQVREQIRRALTQDVVQLDFALLSDRTVGKRADRHAA